MSKVKTVFTDAEIAHVWANKGAPRGNTRVSVLMFGGRGSRQSFNGDEFSSYTTVIARRITHKGRVAYLLDTTTAFGPTTNKHISGVRDALRDGVKVFKVDIGNRGQSLNLSPAQLRDHYLSIWIEKAEHSRYAHIRAERFLHRYRGLDMAIDVCQFFGLACAKLIRERVKAQVERAVANQTVETKRAALRAASEVRSANRSARWKAANDARVADAIKLAESVRDGTTLPDDYAHITGYTYGDNVAHLESRPDLQAVIRQKVAEREAATIADWMAGKPANPKADWPTLLRAEYTKEVRGIGDEITVGEMVTTKGARVPLTDAKRAYLFAMRLRARGWHRNGEQFKVGMYDLDAINEVGVIAGCHRVTWSEIERFAALMGWTVPQSI